MRRMLVVAVVMSLGSTPLLFAEQSLLQAGARHVRQLSSAETTVPPIKGAGLGAAGMVAARPRADALAAQQAGGARTLQSSGLGKRTKWVIAIGAAAAFIGSVYAIDHSVEDVTPSSLGTRRD